MLPVLCAFLVIAAGSNTWINQKILSHKIAVWFGLISFPLYLWHWPILSLGRIIYNNAPPTIFKLIGVALAIFLAWLTVVFIEKPFRFGNKRVVAKVALLCFIFCVIEVLGFIVSNSNLAESHTQNNLFIKRIGGHLIGSSLAWYRGKDDWLFLGNAYDDSVSKLELTIVPTKKKIDSTHESFSRISKVAANLGAKVILIVGPNKENVYPEFLPDEITPSTIQYSSFFLDNLKNIDNLIIYNPLNDFIRLKNAEGILYWMTDTHWNYKGAFLAYSGFSNKLGLPIPEVEFQHGSTHRGDIIDISKLKDFPLHTDDNWDIVWPDKLVITEKPIPDQQKSPFGLASIVFNQKPLSNKSIWVVGDSYAGPLRPYFNATFKEVRYIGHWSDKKKTLADELMKADKKPDLVVVILVERSF